MIMAADEEQGDQSGPGGQFRLGSLLAALAAVVGLLALIAAAVDIAVLGW